jgi:hypothetical protein
MKVALTSKNGVYVDSLADARDVFLKFIAAGNLGASELSRNAGLVTENGDAIARISYNGRVWTPEPYPKCKEINLCALSN